MHEEFYKKISPVIKGKTYLIPPPRLSPKEREKRRLTYRNERKLFRTKSALSGTEMISVFRPDTKFKIYTKDEWWSDNWDPLSFGRDFNFDKPFFDQFHELMLDVPRPPLINNKALNSDYCNFADGNKNCYMTTSSNWNEDCYYNFLIIKCRDTADSFWCTQSELLYECVDCRNCYNLNHAQKCENCSDSAFLYDCKGCSNCILCVNLRNKQNHVLNKPCAQDIYLKSMKQLQNNISEYKKLMEEFKQLKTRNPVQYGNFINCENVSGDNIFNSKNIHMGFDVYNSEDCAYLHDGLNARDCHDICFFDGAELCYESTSLIGYGYRFTNFCRDSYDLFYCDNCHNSKNLFGCVGLRNKEYCIFNRQYSKDEYEELMARIIMKMIETSEWGEFFPSKHSPFPYEDTLANDYF